MTSTVSKGAAGGPSPRHTTARGGRGGSGAFTLKTEVTVPKSELRHYITDDELDRLGEMKRDRLREIFWASIGVFAGSIVPAVEAASRLNATANPMGLTGLLYCLLASASLCSILVSGYIGTLRSRGRHDLLEEIRGRPRVKIGTAG